MEARGSPAASRSSAMNGNNPKMTMPSTNTAPKQTFRSEEHTSELQSRSDLVCRLLLEKKKKKIANLLKAERHTTQYQYHSVLGYPLLLKTGSTTLSRHRLLTPPQPSRQLVPIHTLNNSVDCELSLRRRHQPHHPVHICDSILVNYHTSSLIFLSTSP